MTEDQQGNPKQRERSRIAFPYGDLDDAIEISNAIHTNGGQQCTQDQLAAWLNLTVAGGGFRTRLSTARIFGLIEVARQSVTLTELGQEIVDPERERDARARAFLVVPLYRAVFESYRGRRLPPDGGLEQELVKLGVAQKQRVRARQALQRSAEQAGFFSRGRDRLVAPGGVGAPQPAISPESADNDPEPAGDAARHHPLIEGLFQTLPEPGARWSQARQKQWLEAAERIFGLLFVSDAPAAVGTTVDEEPPF